MRIVAAAVVLALSAAISLATGSHPAASAASTEVQGASPISARAHAEFPKQPRGGKPAAGGGTDTCRWAHDNECDEPDIGTGACRMGTDFSDCRHLRTGEDDSCRWARDGECDEPNFGTGACTQGTDRTDCGQISWMRNQTDRCETAFNGVCEEPGHGDGHCAARTDRSDCHGRDRPLTINDHFFGHDDRVLVPPADLPWRFVGRLSLDAGESCTATLIGPNVIVTAAHCIHDNGRLNAGARFTAAGGGSARVIAYYIDRHFDYTRFTTTNDIDGLDWALLRLDQPLGDRVGFAGVQNLIGRGNQRALAADLMQAGYSWDTGEHLSGNLRCHMVTINRDNTFAHECDTTRGDSGSSFIVRNGQGYDVIGVDSNFRSNPNGPFLYIAVGAAGFQPYVADFTAGRIGTSLNAGKPKDLARVKR